MSKTLFIDKHPVIWASLITIALFVLVNLVARWMIEEPLKTLEFSDAILSAIYGQDKLDDYKQVFAEQSVGQKYWPFVEYVEKERRGKFVNVSSQGNRCATAGETDCEPAGGPNEIWVFGGSTTFGYSVKDDETIPAWIGKLLPNSSVINFGAASFYSNMERIRFQNLLLKFSPPSCAIFIDGLNDFGHLEDPDATEFSSLLAAEIGRSTSEKVGSYVHRRLSVLPIYRLYKQQFVVHSTPTDASDTDLRRAIKRLEFNHAVNVSVGGLFGVTVLNVIQPVPVYGAGHNNSPFTADLDARHELRAARRAYGMMFGANAGRQNLRRLNRLYLQDLRIDAPMYVDAVHYSPAFNKAIAEAIVRALRMKDTRAASKLNY